MRKKWIIVGVVLIAAAVFGDTALYFFYHDISRLAKERPGKTAFMEYRERQWQRQGIHKSISQQWVPLTRMSPYAVKAVIIAEDDKFWSHEGFDFEAIHKALEKDIQKRKFKVGGSTISQQLAKNLYLNPSKNPVRKLKEAILTWRLERNLSKKRIIELYLNVAEWGDGLFGIEAASRHYWGKSSAELTAREAAQLAVVLPSPLRYRPGGGGRYVNARAEVIYQIMVKRGIVIPDYEDTITAPDVAGPDVARADKREGEAPRPPTGGAGTRSEAELLEGD